MSFLSKTLLTSSAIATFFACSTTLATPITDVQEYANNTATEYFVDSDANKYDSPYYRDGSQDWSWTHTAIAGSFSSISLQISAFDVDYQTPTSGEIDMIYIYDGSTWQSLGALAGNDDIWAFTSFDLSGYAWAEAQVNAGLQVKMDIDALNDGWMVTLGKSTLDLDGGSQTCVPTPGSPCATNVSEPSGLALLALGLLGLTIRRKYQK